MAIPCWPARSATRARELMLILMPTEACQFRCVYCYQSFPGGKMRPSVVSAVKRLLTRRAADLDRLRLSWFGGEPLLAVDVIEDVSRRAARLARARPSLEYTADITTNAWLLTPAVLERLCGLGVGEFQITFDGEPAEHDRARVLAGGGPTFARVWANVLAMRSSRRLFKAVLRVHLDAENLGSVERFTARFRRELGGDERFELFLRPLARLGGANDARLRVLDQEAAARAGRRLALGCKLLGVPTSKRPRSPVCYASQLNAWVVRADGRLGKCTVALDEPANDVGVLLPDGTMKTDPERLKPWVRGLLTGDERDLACPRSRLSLG